MTKKDPFENIKEEDLRDFNNKCEECKKEDESVSQNLILTGFKLCKSCRTSKTIFQFSLYCLSEERSFCSLRMKLTRMQ